MKKWHYFFIIAISCFSLYVLYKKSVEQNILAKFGVVTIGEIVGFRHSGKSSYTLIYRYQVGDNIHKEEIPSKYFFCKEADNSGCVGLKFKVIYSKSNPSISDIDLEHYNKYKGMRLYY